MAGHSQFKNIMHRKGAQDAKRAKVFAKLGREIFVAARSGLPDPNFNPRLRTALAAARAGNMPKENIDRALKKASGSDEGNFDEVRYEGYGPGGTALIVEALTDNRNRTASDVRAAFSKNGGNMGETGSVSFQFERIGFFQFPKNNMSFDSIFEIAVNAGADNAEDTNDFFEITCSDDSFASVRDSLLQSLGDPLEAKIIWHPTNFIECSTDVQSTLIKMMDALDDSDDVQHIYCNATFND
jgi:YebC/PmpR family DNA-binding regulatory protein